MMSPLSIHDPAYGALTEPVPRGNIGLGVALGASRSDVCNVNVGQLAAHQRGADSIGVQEITEPSLPFKISGMVVRLDEVDVVDLGEIVRVWDERERNEAVHLGVSDKGAKSEVNRNVSSLARPCLQDTTDPGILVLCGRPWFCEASDAPEVADFVELAERLDRNRSPLLNCCVIHAAGFLSGDDRLGTKSLPRAPTLGGLAFYSATASRTQEIGG